MGRSTADRVALFWLVLGTLLAPAWAADGAQELTNPADVRARREATRGRPAPQAASDTTASNHASDATPATVTIRTTEPEETDDAPVVAQHPPLTRPALVLGVEYGWYDMTIDSGTTRSDSGGSLGTDYAVGYRIDPFSMTTVRSSARIGDWGVAALAGVDGTDSELGSTLAGMLQRYDADEAGWWEAAVTWARLRGTATTATAAGDPLTEEVDSTWRRVALYRRTYPRLCWGVVFEDVAMPSAYSLDDPDGQVLAFFDDGTRWRTLSATIGIDSSIATALERNRGWMPLYEAHAGLGAGALHYDARAVEHAAAMYGYQVDDSDGFVLTARAEAVLGVAAAGTWEGVWCQAAIGARFHGAWYSTLTEHDAENPTSATYDTLVLNSSVSMVTYGGFARILVLW
jgi:hypothetical protein